MLEAKAKDQGHKRKCSPKKKKKSLHKNFLGDLQNKKKKKRSSQTLFKRSPQKNVFQKIFQALHKILTIQKILLSSSRGQANFRGLEASRPRPRTWPSRPRPRTSKCVLEDVLEDVLEAKDVLEDSTSAPHILSGIGKDHANVCIELLYKWNIAEQVRGLVFDTTASNTGIYTGACTLIEKALGRELVWVACRHHIMEVVLSSVFKAVMGDTTGPCVEVFKRFQSQWNVINKENFDLPDEADFQGICHLREEAKETYKELFDTTFPRDDYRDFLELCMIFVGGKKESYIFKEFRALGGVSNAWWMSKAIYAIKIVLFGRQFTLPLELLEGLTSVALFVAVVYGKFWFQAPLAHLAAFNNLIFLREMNHYPHDVIRAAGTNSMLRHLWYFSERLVASAFFDDRVSNNTKESITKNLHKNPTTTNLARSSWKDFDCRLGLENYVTRRSMCFFDLIEANGQKKSKIIPVSTYINLADRQKLNRNEINCVWAESSKRYSRKRCCSHSGIQWQPYSRRRTTTILAPSSCSSSSSCSQPTKRY